MKLIFCNGTHNIAVRTNVVVQRAHDIMVEVQVAPFFYIVRGTRPIEAAEADKVQKTVIVATIAQSREENSWVYGSIRFTHQDGTEMPAFIENTKHIEFGRIRSICSLADDCETSESPIGRLFLLVPTLLI